MVVMRLNEIEAEMCCNWEKYQSFNDKDSSKVETGENGSQVSDDFDKSSKRYIECIWFVWI